MIYLFSTEIGHDANSIGFPSVETCFAIVLQTDVMLIGWHSFNTLLPQTTANAGVFANYITSVPAHGTAVHLYGATNRKGHGGDWKAELRAIAGQIGYTGPATLVDLKQSEGTYVQFDRDAHARTCLVTYKRNAKMLYTKTDSDINAIPHRRIHAGAVAPLYGGDDGLAPVYTAAHVHPLTSSSRRLHTAGWGNTTNFTIT